MSRRQSNGLVPFAVLGRMCKTRKFISDKSETLRHPAENAHLLACDEYRRIDYANYVGQGPLSSGRSLMANGKRVKPQVGGR